MVCWALNITDHHSHLNTAAVVHPPAVCVTAIHIMSFALNVTVVMLSFSLIQSQVCMSLVCQRL